MKYKYDLLIDIDGVVRDLYTPVSKALGRALKSWEDGEIVFDLAKEDGCFLLNCEPTKYLKIIKDKIENPIFISHQISSWRLPTRWWISLYFDCYKIIFTNSAEDKVKYFKQAKYIIEDCPLHKDYSRIILIDAPYNQNVKNPLVRITTAKQLEKFLKVRGIK